MNKKDFRKINDYLWEVPKGFREDMRVPARLYASERLLEDTLRDQSLNQLVNTATLPGIVKHALAMPDIHEGYGFPIGGVVATELPHGVISPGGVGYDINCLAGDSRILHEHGYTLSIAAMEDQWPMAVLRCQSFAHGREATTPVLRYFKRRRDVPVYRLTTQAGDEILATADHPFWTPDGMVELAYLSSGDRVAVYPFSGVEYEAPSSETIADEGDIERLLHRLGKTAGHTLPQVIRHLNRLHLLPLQYDTPVLPHLIKLLGYVMGDGTLYLSGGDGKGTTWFYGDPDDLERIRADVKALGFTPSRVYTRQRSHRIETAYQAYQFEREESSFKVVSSAFALLLAVLGMPIGSKADQDFGAPAWLAHAPLWQKRLFLAALFGAELTAPQTFDKHGYNFYTPILSMNKRDGFVESGYAFLQSIAGMLEEFGVKVKSISRRQEQTNADGSISFRLRLVLSSTPPSLLSLWGMIGFEYNQKRRDLAHAAVQYLKQKEQIVEYREQVAEKAVALHQAGVALGEIYGQLTDPYINRRFLERSLYEGRETRARVSSAFPTFETFLETAVEGLAGTGMVWAQTVRIEPVEDFDDYVYDFTVAHTDHNFIANSFVVSNCGVRLSGTHLLQEEVAPYLNDLATALYHNCPSGVGEKGHLRLSQKELDELTVEGSKWALKKGYARKEDVERTEESGQLAGADPAHVSQRAKQRGMPQVGTLGAGNHFIEVDVIDEVYDAEAADAMGLRRGGIAVQIHCGSRGFGHQVCDDYVRQLQPVVHKYGIQLPDRQLVCAPLDSPEGKAYFAAMACAANYAFANRQVLLHYVRLSFEQVLAGKVDNWDVFQVYDIAHNMAKIETHEIDGKKKRVCVHRKGATRAFGPGFEGLPAEYRAIGQPVLVPGSMGTMSFVLVGTQDSMEHTFGSTCHGAGRTMSRAQAKKQVHGGQLKDRLEQEGIVIRAGSLAGLAEEAPAAYKEVDNVVEVVHGAGIARKVARLRPLAVVKG
jgi:tRNA-splicing ligase RtcB